MVVGVIDGATAGEIGNVNEFRSKMDTSADFVLVTVWMIKLELVIYMSMWFIIWIIIIAAIKAINLISGYIMRN